MFPNTLRNSLPGDPVTAGQDERATQSTCTARYDVCKHANPTGHFEHESPNLH